MNVLVLALIIVALILAAVHEFNNGGRELVGWAVVALAAALLIPQFA